jgi:hypothetical protein
MLVQQLLLTFSCFWIVTSELSSGNREYRLVEEFILAFLAMVSVHWYFMGTLMNGEMPRLSNRAKRRLPQSLLGRAFLTWFNPGSASGYVFAILNLTAAMWMLAISLAVWQTSQNAMQLSTPMPRTAFGPSGFTPTMGVPRWRELAYVCALTFGYVVFYLGLGRLSIALLRRVATVGLFLAVLIQFLIFMIGTFAPPVIDQIAGNRFNEYRFWHIPSIGATMETVNRQTVGSGVEVVVIVVLFGALGVFCLNLPGIMAEVRQVRAKAPQRVIEEEEALHPKPVVVAVNPFE